MPISSSCPRMYSCRSLVAVGSGGRVGPTGRPIITMPPLSDEGYWSRKIIHSRDILYWHSRALGQLAAAHDSYSCSTRFGQIAPADEYDPAPPRGMDGSKYST